MHSEDAQGSGGLRHDRGTFAVFAVIDANYQPSTWRSPRKSWADNGTANQRTAAAPAVLSLFCAVLKKSARRVIEFSWPQPEAFC
jgi:hypothetical protein